MTKPPPPVFLPGKSMDRGAWWATVYGVVKSQTWMSNWVQWYGMNQRLWLIQFCTLETQKKKKKEVNKDTACAGCLEAAIWGPQTSQWKPWRAGKVTRCNDSSQRLPRKERKGRLPKHGPQTIKLQLFNIFFALLYYYHVIYWKRRKKNSFISAHLSLRLVKNSYLLHLCPPHWDAQGVFSDWLILIYWVMSMTFFHWIIMWWESKLCPTPPEKHELIYWWTHEADTHPSGGGFSS